MAAVRDVEAQVDALAFRRRRLRSRARLLRDLIGSTRYPMARETLIAQHEQVMKRLRLLDLQAADLISHEP